VPIIGGGSGGGGGSSAPGFEIGYAQITSPVNVTDTAEATATALISSGALTFDGAPVIAEFYCMQVVTDSAAASDLVIVTLFEGASQICRLAEARTIVTTAQNVPSVYARFRFTPTAASHTYKLCAFATSTTGTPALNCGGGGTGGLAPCFLRFTKV
jgi:hypothetical protein